MKHFYHIINRDEWEAAKAAGSYSPASVDSEGFIHCSYPSQVLMPANLLFKGQYNLILLEIDPAKVVSEVRHDPVEVTRFEDTAQELFPHIYGPLNPDAVVSIINFPPHVDGTFHLPAKFYKIEQSPDKPGYVSGNPKSKTRN